MFRYGRNPEESRSGHACLDPGEKQSDGRFKSAGETEKREAELRLLQIDRLGVAAAAMESDERQAERVSEIEWDLGDGRVVFGFAAGRYWREGKRSKKGGCAFECELEGDDVGLWSRALGFWEGWWACS
ncbi:unnamed protein product [Linum trigynum]|uniref:Uncharacterized protein n=1 Tax=Linum trigynum TaxID=586398 RepID=A0AAV2FMG8_9ROSI